MTNPAAGWYPDPYGQAVSRYWDGALWTGHTSGAVPASAPAPVAPAAPAPAAPTAPPAPAATQGPATGGDGEPRFSRGFVESRLRNTRTLVTFLGAFAVIVIGGALAISLLGGGGDVARDCPEDRVCSDPPAGDPLVNLSIFRGQAGFAFGYNDEEWKVAEESADEVVLQHRLGDAQLVILGSPSAQADPQALADELLGRISDDIVGIAEDSDPADRLFGPSIGYVDGIGGSYAGAVDTPQGLGEVSAVVMAAERDGVSAGAMVVTGETRPSAPGEFDRKDAILNAVDSVLNSFSFSGEPT